MDFDSVNEEIENTGESLRRLHEILDLMNKPLSEFKKAYASIELNAHDIRDLEIVRNLVPIYKSRGLLPDSFPTDIKGLCKSMFDTGMNKAKEKVRALSAVMLAEDISSFREREDDTKP